MKHQSMQPGEEPVALDPQKSNFWAQRPSVHSVDCPVILTDLETPVRIRVRGSHLPIKDRPPSKALGCTCSVSSAQNGPAANGNRAQVSDVEAVQTQHADNCPASKTSDAAAKSPSPERLHQKACCMERADKQRNVTSAGAENGSWGKAPGNGTNASLGMHSNSADMLVPSSSSVASLGNDAGPGTASLGKDAGPVESGGALNCAATLPQDLSRKHVLAGDIIARCRGDDQMFLRSFCKKDTPSGALEVEVKPPQLEPGGSAIVWLEGWSGIFMSPAVPVLVTTDVELACTVQALLEQFRRAEEKNVKVRLLISHHIWHRSWHNGYLSSTFT
jgi:hypothetical protein